MLRPNQTPEASKPRRRLLLLLAIGLGLLVLVIMLLAGFIVREGLMANRVNMHMPSRQYLEKIHAINHDPQATQENTNATMTTQTLSRSTQIQRGSVEVLADHPSLHPVFRAQRDAINRRVTDLLSRAEEYERTHAQLSPEEAQKQLSSIGEAWRNDELAFDQLRRSIKDVRERAAQQHLLQPVRDAYYSLYNWHDAHRIKVNERKGNFHQAAFLAEHYIDNRRADWLGSRPPGHPVYVSDYYRGPGREDYQRVIYYYWKAGGLNGYAKILDVALPNYYQRLVDAWKKSEAGGKNKQ